MPDGWGRVPAAAVIASCLDAQGDAPARSAFARLIGRSPLTAESRPWYLGALGELRVAARLGRLGPEWTILHSVPIGDRGSDIDHVVIGDAGIFTINTKFHESARVWVGSARLLVNGQKVDHLSNSRYEAQRVARRLSERAGVPVEVHPVVVLVGVRSLTFRERPADVGVLQDGRLVGWLKRRPAVLTGELHERLRSIAIARESWTDSATRPVDPDLGAFAALCRDVRVARRVRMLWATALAAGLIAVAGASVTAVFATLTGA